MVGAYFYAAYHEGQWYFFKTEWEQEGYCYYGYLVDDPEIVDYLSDYAERYIK